MDWDLWTVFVVTDAALIVTPGPAVLFIVSRGLRGGSSGALWAALGILTANSLYFAASGTGIGAVLAASDSLFTMLKWAGAGYLFCLGASALLRTPPPPARCETSQGIRSPRSALALGGFALQLSNPKALVFFVAILPQFIDRSGPVALQLVVLGVTSIALELVVLAAYGIAAARAGRIAIEPRFATATSRISGLLLVGAALGLSRLER